MCGEVHAVGAECRADRDLAAPAFHAHEEEVAHVRCGDHQHKEHGAEQHPQRARDLGSQHGLAERRDAHAEVVRRQELRRVRVGHLVRESREQGRELRLRGIGRHTGLEPAHADVGMGVPERARRVDALRQPEVDTEAGEVAAVGEGAGCGQRHAGRGHPDDLVRAVRRDELAADDARIPAEAALVVLVTQHHEPRLAGQVVIGAEQAAVLRAGPEHVEDRMGRIRDAGELGVAAAGHRGAEGAVDGEGLERPAVAREVDVSAGRDAPDAFAAAGYGGGMRHGDEPVRLGIRQRAEQHGVEHGEHRRSGADAQRERRERDQRKRPLAPQDTYRVPRLAPERAEELRTCRLPQRVLVDAACGAAVVLDVAEPSRDLRLGLSR